MNELVSILIPAYNAEKWMKETLNSAVGQSWPNYEIIVVNDGSSDNTLKIAEQFASKSVKVITQENMGASAARNNALSCAQGDYIQWLDADDLLAPDKISQQLKNHDPDPLILLSSAFAQFYFCRHRAVFSPSSLWKDLSPVEWFITRFSDKVWMNPAVWLISRPLTGLIGPWDERLSLNDDGEYFARAVAASKEVKFVPEAKSYYRQANVKSLSKTSTHKGNESLFLSLRLCYGYMLALENSERTRAAALRHLQNCLLFFYPEEHEILAQADELAKELGGTLSPPKLKNKYLMVRALFGWSAARNMAIAVPRLKKRVIRDL